MLLHRLIWIIFTSMERLDCESGLSGLLCCSTSACRHRPASERGNLATAEKTCDSWPDAQVVVHLAKMSTTYRYTSFLSTRINVTGPCKWLGNLGSKRGSGKWNTTIHRYSLTNSKGSIRRVLYALQVGLHCKIRFRVPFIASSMEIGEPFRSKKTSVSWRMSRK
jgi:hypothetical protein